jgi:hypothetical protein
VLSDTHPPRRWKSCPPQVTAGPRDVDVILHAGDVCTPDVLDELSSWAPEEWVRAAPPQQPSETLCGKGIQVTQPTTRSDATRR